MDHSATTPVDPEVTEASWKPLLKGGGTIQLHIQGREPKSLKTAATGSLIIKMSARNYKFDTLQVHAGQKPDRTSGGSAV